MNRDLILLTGIALAAAGLTAAGWKLMERSALPEAGTAELRLRGAYLDAKTAERKALSEQLAQSGLRLQLSPDEVQVPFELVRHDCPELDLLKGVYAIHFSSSGTPVSVDRMSGDAAEEVPSGILKCQFRTESDVAGKAPYFTIFTPPRNADRLPASS
jgi:hypothetical protein